MYSKRDHTTESLTEMLRVQEKRVESVGQEDKPTADELAILECFWNPHFYTLKDWVPIEAILDTETQKLTSLNDCEPARRLIGARIQAMMDLGYIGNEGIYFDEHGETRRQKLWLTSKGATHFATGIPNILRQPLTFARRHLALFQLAAVVISILVALGTFAAHMFGWF
jgi:S-adenosylmethionine:diacylglycerol 3-amino-3-carboxypropyl transferase